MKVVEKFISINGEGVCAGELAVFVRFQICNLHCTYCDTMWANVQTCDFEELSPEQIADYIKSTGVLNVTLTGGEPLLQEDMPKLLSLLALQKGLRVEIETNGSIDLSKFCYANRPVFTMDYKLPASSCENSMCLSNFNLLCENDTVKFVCSDITDLKRSAEIIKKYKLQTKCHVYLSPVFNKINPADMVNFMIENRLNSVRLQLQIHKFIWNPDQRGV